MSDTQANGMTLGPEKLPILKPTEALDALFRAWQSNGKVSICKGIGSAGGRFLMIVGSEDDIAQVLARLTTTDPAVILARR
jgi:hypothetical protein